MTEEAIEILKKFKTKGYYMLYIKYGDRIQTNFKIEKAIDTVLQALENSIPKQAIENKIKKHKKEYEEILSEYGNIDTEVIINVPNKNVRKYLDELIIKCTTLEDILAEVEEEEYERDKI